MTTIREQLTRQAKLAGWAGVVGFAMLFPLGFALIHMHLPRDVAKYCFVAGTLLVSGVSVLLHRRIRCPRCNVRLLGVSRGLLIGALNFCPKCGANFNEKMPP